MDKVSHIVGRTDQGTTNVGYKKSMPVDRQTARKMFQLLAERKRGGLVLRCPN